jgi:tRNA pseudouridine38-40 synthase
MVFVLSYDGTKFKGWADVSSKVTQDFNKPVKPRTVQGTIESFLTKLHGGRTVRLRAASRTDSGVHARGQVASYVWNEHHEMEETGAHKQSNRPWRESSIIEPHEGDPVQLMNALNRMLPVDVRVVKAFRASKPNFHSTFDATSKEYSYVVDSSPLFVDPLVRRFRWHCPSSSSSSTSSTTSLSSGQNKNDREGGGGWLGPEVAEACAALVGTHDFEAFRGAPKGSARKSQQQQEQQEVSAVCTLSSVEVRPLLRSSSQKETGIMHDPNAHAVRITVVGDRFVYKMVRNLVGCLAEVAEGSRSVASIQCALKTTCWDNRSDSDDDDDGSSETSLLTVSTPDSLTFGDDSSPWIEEDCPCSDFGDNVPDDLPDVPAAVRKFPKDFLKPLCAPAHGLCLERVYYDSVKLATKLTTAKLLGLEVGEGSRYESRREKAACDETKGPGYLEVSEGTAEAASFETGQAHQKQHSRRAALGRSSSVVLTAAAATASVLSTSSPANAEGTGFFSFLPGSGSQASTTLPPSTPMKALIAVVRTRAKVADIERVLAQAVATQNQKQSKEVTIPNDPGSSVASLPLSQVPENNMAPQQTTSDSSAERLQASSVSSALGTARTGAKEAVNSFKLRENTKMGVAFLRATRGGKAADEAEAHAFGAIEYLSS